MFVERLPLKDWGIRVLEIPTEVFCSINNIDFLEVPQKIGRPGSTLPQLIGEYYWVTFTRKCKLPSHETVQKWAKWSQAPEPPKSDEF